MTIANITFVNRQESFRLNPIIVFIEQRCPTWSDKVDDRFCVDSAEFGPLFEAGMKDCLLWVYNNNIVKDFVREINGSFDDYKRVRNPIETEEIAIVEKEEAGLKEELDGLYELARNYDSMQYAIFNIQKTWHIFEAEEADPRGLREPLWKLFSMVVDTEDQVDSDGILDKYKGIVYTAPVIVDVPLVYHDAEEARIARLKALSDYDAEYRKQQAAAVPQELCGDASQALDKLSWAEFQAEVNTSLRERLNKAVSSQEAQLWGKCMEAAGVARNWVLLGQLELLEAIQRVVSERFEQNQENKELWIVFTEVVTEALANQEEFIAKHKPVLAIEQAPQGTPVAVVASPGNRSRVRFVDELVFPIGAQAAPSAAVVYVVSGADDDVFGPMVQEEDGDEDVRYAGLTPEQIAALKAQEKEGQAVAASTAESVLNEDVYDPVAGAEVRARMEEVD